MVCMRSINIKQRAIPYCGLCGAQANRRTYPVHSSLQDKINTGAATGWLKLVERASDSRIDDTRFEPHQEHKKTLGVFPSQKCCGDSLSVCLTPSVIKKKKRTHQNDHVRRLKILDEEDRCIDNCLLTPSQGRGSYQCDWRKKKKKKKKKKQQTKGVNSARLTSHVQQGAQLQRPNAYSSCLSLMTMLIAADSH